MDLHPDSGVQVEIGAVGRRDLDDEEMQGRQRPVGRRGGGKGSATVTSPVCASTVTPTSASSASKLRLNATVRVSGSSSGSSLRKSSSCLRFGPTSPGSRCRSRAEAPFQPRLVKLTTPAAFATHVKGDVVPAALGCHPAELQPGGGCYGKSLRCG